MKRAKFKAISSKRRKVKFHLIETTCKRCGVKLYSGNRSLYGLDKVKKELDRICNKCITPEEQRRILELKPIMLL